MSPRPTIFISAVSRELKTARQLVANTLSFLGYEPIWQDIFGTEQGDLRAVLRRQIDSSKGVVQLVGDWYGAEPPEPDPEFGRVSYTQYEALYAKKQGKKLWYLVLDQTFPDDGENGEPQELRELQAAYRRRVEADVHLFHPLTSREALENSVLKLRDDLTSLRRGVKQWAVGVAALLLLSVGLGFWMLQRQQHSSEELAQTTGAMKEMEQEMVKLRQGVAEFADAQAKARAVDSSQNNAEIEEQTYAELGKRTGLDPALLKKQLPVVAKQLEDSKNASGYDRANAAFVSQDYQGAERLALAAADEAQKARPPKPNDAIAALVLASNAARARVDYAASLDHLQAAEKLTDRSRDGATWAGVQMALAQTQDDLGHYREAEPILRGVVEERTGTAGPNDSQTLTARHSLALSLLRQGKLAEAESEARAVLELRSKTLPAGSLDTAMTRNLLGGILSMEGKTAQAEAELRQVLELREKALGPEQPETLRTRADLAMILSREGKHEEAEKEDRILVAAYTKRRGAEHPETLRMRDQLAIVLVLEGKGAEAEAETRATAEILSRTLGPEHPETLAARHGLAMALNQQDKGAEAEKEAREVIALRTKVLGAEHPHTVATRHVLAEALRREGRFDEAAAEEREVIALRTKALGPEHPETLMSRAQLVVMLNLDHKLDEAEKEGREVLALREKTLGPANPQTQNSRRALAKVLREEGKHAEAAALRPANGAPPSDGSD